MCMQITRKHKRLPKKGWKPRKIAHFWDAMSILSGLAWNVAKNLGPNILARPNFRPNTLNLFINFAQHFRPSLKCRATNQAQALAGGKKALFGGFSSFFCFLFGLHHVNFQFCNKKNSLRARFLMLEHCFKSSAEIRRVPTASCVNMQI